MQELRNSLIGLQLPTGVFHLVGFPRQVAFTGPTVPGAQVAVQTPLTGTLAHAHVALALARGCPEQVTVDANVSTRQTKNTEAASA